MSFPFTLGDLLGGDDAATAGLAHIQDHAEQAVKLLLSQYQKASIQNLVRASLGELQRLEDAAWTIFVYRSIAGASGLQLTKIGDLLQWPRFTVDDEVYRRQLQGVALAHVSSGTPEQLIAIAWLMVGKVNPIKLTELFPKAVCVRIQNSFVGDAATILKILTLAKEAGSRLILEYRTSDDTGTFTCCNVGDTNNAALGFGDTGNSATGGKLAQVIGTD